jgi:hypothetical protein
MQVLQVFPGHFPNLVERLGLSYGLRAATDLQWSVVIVGWHPLHLRQHVEATDHLAKHGVLVVQVVR